MDTAFERTEASGGATSDLEGSGVVRGPIAAAADPGTAPGSADPPLLTGGLEPGGEDVCGVPVGVGIDFLTVSMSSEVSAAQQLRGKLVEEGGSRPGFARSELWDVVGGQAWRRYEPRQASRAFGLDYESWEASGGAAACLAWDLIDQPVRPSRVDVAWDFQVDEGLLADEVFERLQAGAERRGFKGGVSGHGGVNTRYIGSPTSERRIRIYRRDLKDKAVLFHQGPVLRVEVVLRDDVARGWWAVWSRDQAAGWAAAAAHVHEMTGRRVQADVGQVPELERVPEAVDAAQMFFDFVQQHASTVKAAQEAGVDLFGLVGLMSETWAKSTQSRHRRRVGALVAAGAKEVEELVRAMIVAKLRALPG